MGVMLPAKHVCIALNEMDYESEIVTLRNGIILLLCKMFHILLSHF